MFSKKQIKRIRERLEASGIVNGEIVDEEKLNIATAQMVAQALESYARAEEDNPA